SLKYLMGKTCRRFTYQTSNPADFRRAWVAVINAARSEADERVQNAWRECSSLASICDIINKVPQLLMSRGVVGEDKITKLVFLIVVSRLLPRPVSLTVKGPSSGGKSYLVEQVLSLFPGLAFYEITAMSERALAYSEEPLK